MSGIKKLTAAVIIFAGVRLFSQTPEAIPPGQGFTITKNAEWAELPVCFEPPAKGSLLDFSDMTVRPAGKYGRIIPSADGHFTFENAPDKRIRLNGPNLCFSANFLKKDDALKLAETFRRLGYNTVRLHHYDILLIKGGWESKNSFDIDPEQLDKLDFMFAAMKDAGMYVMTDLYTIRRFEKGEIQGWDSGAHMNIKALIPILPGAFDAWSKMVLKLMNHVNPYTKTAWKDDPALAGICPVNEDAIVTCWKNSPKVAQLYYDAFESFLEKKSKKGVSGRERDDLMTGFLIETKMNSNRKISDFLKKNGIHSMLSGSNWMDSQHQTFMRNQFDYVDNHQYWDHPVFKEKSWDLPTYYHQKSALNDFCYVPNMMPVRIFGKPFTVSEFNFCPPNRYRAEGGAVMGAYAALQDWDGLYRFAWSHGADNILKQKPVSRFDTATDPVSRLTEIQTALLFTRGDVSPAKNRFVYAVTFEEAAAQGVPDWHHGGFPADFSRLGLVSQIGSQPVWRQTSIRGKFASAAAKIPVPAEKLNGNTLKTPGELKAMLPASGDIVSDTGEIIFNNEKGTLKIVTPKTECLVSPAAETPLKGKCLSVRSSTAFSSISASAMDDAPLASSKRILILHITNVLNTGMRFRAPDMRVLEATGTLPYLVAAGKAEISLSAPDGLTLHALDFSGRRIRKVPFTNRCGTYDFELSTVPEKDAPPCMIYELAAD